MDFPQLNNEFFNLNSFAYGSQYLKYSTYHKFLHGEVRKWYNIITLAGVDCTVEVNEYYNNGICIDFLSNTYDFEPFVNRMYPNYPDVNAFLHLSYNRHGIDFYDKEVVVPPRLQTFLDSLPNMEEKTLDTNYKIFWVTLRKTEVDNFNTEFAQLLPEYCYADGNTKFYKIDNFLCSVVPYIIDYDDDHLAYELYILP